MLDSLRFAKYAIVGAVILFGFESMQAQGQYKTLSEEVSLLEEVDLLVMPPRDNEKLRKQYKFYEAPTPGEPMIFADKMEVSVDPSINGVWESSLSGDLVWRQRIQSKDAYSLNLGFTNFHLPSSAALFIYDLEKTYVIGPIHQGDNDLHGEWWSPIIPGDEVVLEVQIDPSEAKQLEMTLGYVNHDFSGFDNLLSGSCNLDVECGAEDGFPLNDRFREMINSVGRVVISGSNVCTGVLVNNTAQDCTPYLLSANHCRITSSSAPSVIVYWNYQNTTCRQPNSSASGSQGNGSLRMFNSGSIFRARYDVSDFALVELDDPVDPETNPYFAGWDWQTNSADSTFTVHHPDGDEKRISYDFDNAIFNVSGSYVQVLDWDVGTTERGSSGCPLFNFNGHILGLLNAGSAACGNNLQDDFGMISLSWEGGGTPETRLKDWLDPLNLGIPNLDGKFCNDAAAFDVDNVFICTSTDSRDTVRLDVISGFDSAAALSSSHPDGVNISFSNSTIQAGETIEIYLEITDSFEDDSGIITVIFTGDASTTSTSFSFVLEENNPDVTVLQTPVHFAEDLILDILFSWIDNGAQSYELEIALDDEFNNIVRSESLDTNKISLTEFDPSTIYFWRVHASNICGESTSAIFRFSTGEVICKTYSASDVPVTIGDDPVTISSSINIPDFETVSDVNVIDITGRHTWIADLTFSLRSPQGTEVVLVETPCEREDNFFMSFDDRSEIINVDCPLTTGNTYRPLEALSSFNGEPSNGEWQLIVNDGVGQDGGALDEWSLELCFQASTQKSFVIAPSEINVCDKNPGEVEVILALNGIWNNVSTPVISTGSGQSIAASVSPDPIVNAKEIIITIENPIELVPLNEVSISFNDDEDMIVQTIPVIHTVNVREPSLIAPNDNEERLGLIPTFTWVSGIEEGGLHRFILSPNSDLSDPIVLKSTGDNEITIDTTLDEGTKYYWSVIAIGECADLESGIFSFTTDERTSTVDYNLENINVYPTITDQFVRIDLNDVALDDLNYSIFNTSGQQLQTALITDIITDIDVASFSSGLYFLQFRSQKGVFSRKFIVNR